MPAFFQGPPRGAQERIHTSCEATLKPALRLRSRRLSERQRRGQDPSAQWSAAAGIKIDTDRQSEFGSRGRVSKQASRVRCTAISRQSQSHAELRVRTRSRYCGFRTHWPHSLLRTSQR
jgi:hypothetical protein